MSDAPATPPPYDGRPEARRLLRTIRSGTLATVTPEGAPFASLTSIATLVDGRPILLLSRLAAHTRHLDADPRCSLLLAATGKGDPLAHPRLTLTGTARRLSDADALSEAKARFLARQPKAGLYADFPDFGFWLVDPMEGHLNGGFARAARLPAGDFVAEAAPLAAIERGAVEHMNQDHRDALRLYGAVLAGAGDGAWVASGLDADGIDLICGDRVARVLFDEPVTGPADLRGALKALADRARAAEQAEAPAGMPQPGADQ